MRRKDLRGNTRDGSPALNQKGKSPRDPAPDTPGANGMERYGYSPIWRAGMILALCETDRWTDAADQMVAFAEDTDGFRTLPPSGWAMPTLTLLAEACAGLAIHGHYLDELTGLTPLIGGALASHHAEIALAGWPTVLVGPVARARGLLAFAP